MRCFAQLCGKHSFLKQVIQDVYNLHILLCAFYEGNFSIAIELWHHVFEKITLMYVMWYSHWENWRVNNIIVKVLFEIKLFKIIKILIKRTGLTSVLTMISIHIFILPLVSGNFVTPYKETLFFGGGGRVMWLSINSGRDYKMYSLTCNKSKSIPQGYAHVCQGWSSTKVVGLLMY